MRTKPLFVPLYTRWFNEFLAGTKTTEFRKYGRGWNERTCTIGRPVVLSKGYGKYARLNATVIGFEHVGDEARIHLKVEKKGTP